MLGVRSIDGHKRFIGEILWLHIFVGEEKRKWKQMQIYVVEVLKVNKV